MAGHMRDSKGQFKKGFDGMKPVGSASGKKAKLKTQIKERRLTTRTEGTDGVYTTTRVRDISADSTLKKPGVATKDPTGRLKKGDAVPAGSKVKLSKNQQKIVDSRNAALADGRAAKLAKAKAQKPKTASAAPVTSEEKRQQAANNDRLTSALTQTPADMAANAAKMYGTGSKQHLKAIEMAAKKEGAAAAKAKAAAKPKPKLGPKDGLGRQKATVKINGEEVELGRVEKRERIENILDGSNHRVGQKKTTDYVGVDANGKTHTAKTQAALFEKMAPAKAPKKSKLPEGARKAGAKEGGDGGYYSAEGVPIDENGLYRRGPGGKTIPNIPRGLSSGNKKLDDLREDRRQILKELNDTEPSGAAWKKKMAELRQVEAAIDKEQPKKPLETDQARRARLAKSKDPLAAAEADFDAAKKEYSRQMDGNDKTATQRAKEDWINARAAVENEKLKKDLAKAAKEKAAIVAAADGKKRKVSAGEAQLQKERDRLSQEIGSIRYDYQQHGDPAWRTDDGVLKLESELAAVDAQLKKMRPAGHPQLGVYRP